jgi:hypothetical protein
MARTNSAPGTPKRRPAAKAVGGERQSPVMAGAEAIIDSDNIEALPPKRFVKEAVLSVRLDEPTMRRLTKAAERLGLGASTVARMWLLKRLSEEQPSQPGEEWV